MLIYVLTKADEGVPETTEVEAHATRQEAIDAVKDIVRGIYEMRGNEGDYSSTMEEIQDCLENEGEWHDNDEEDQPRVYMVHEVEFNPLPTEGK